MKKNAILALMILATSMTVFAGNGNKKKSKKKAKAKIECCDKTKCCPTVTTTCK